MLSHKQKRCFVYTLTVALLFSVAAVSLVQARAEDESPPVVDENEQPTAATPSLIMTLDGNATAPEDETEQPNLYQSEDSATTTDDNSTGVIAPDAEGSQENSLISTQTSSDYTVLIVGIAGLIAVTAAVGALVLVRKRNKTN